MVDAKLRKLGGGVWICWKDGLLLHFFFFKKVPIAMIYIYFCICKLKMLQQFTISGVHNNLNVHYIRNVYSKWNNWYNINKH